MRYPKPHAQRFPRKLAAGTPSTMSLAQVPRFVTKLRYTLLSTMLVVRYARRAMVSVPVITVTGWSNSGKTTFATRVVDLLSDMGIRVGVIKHHGHKTGGVDVEGKDSWKYAQAGANPVILSASDQYAIFVSTPQGELSCEELVAKIADDVDIVIVEGFRAEADGAVEVYRTAAGHPDPKLDPEERIALVTDNDELAAQVRSEGKPVFALDDFDAVARYFCELAGLEASEL